MNVAVILAMLAAVAAPDTLAVKIKTVFLENARPFLNRKVGLKVRTVFVSKNQKVP